MLLYRTTPSVSLTIGGVLKPKFSSVRSCIVFRPTADQKQYSKILQHFQNTFAVKIYEYEANKYDYATNSHGSQQILISHNKIAKKDSK